VAVPFSFRHRLPPYRCLKNPLNISDFTEQFEVHAGFPALEYQISAVAKMSRKLDSG
jgi:hypothetical protein